MSPPQRTPRERKKPETYIPDLGQSSASSEGRGRGRGRGRGKGRGKGRGTAASQDVPDTMAASQTTSPVSPAAQPSDGGAFIGRRVTVRWEQEEEDFEGFIKRFRPDSTYCYEVAYDDGDEEWGWFSATHFHTDEVQRRFTWLQEQDEQVAKAASKAWAALEGSQHVLSSFEQKASTASVERTSNATAPKAAATATASGAIGNLALRKDQLRAIQDVLSDSKPVIPSPASGSRHKNGLQQASSQSALLAKPSSVSASQQQPASLSDLVPSAAELAVSTQRSAPDANLAAAPNAKPTVSAPDVTSAEPVASKAAHDGQPIMVQEPSRASQLSIEGSLRPKVSLSAAAKLQLETGQQPSKQVTHTKKRKAASFEEPNNSVPETEAPASTHANAVNGHVDEGSIRETAGDQASAASAQEQPAKQIAQPSPKSASLPETLALQAEASEITQEQAQPQGRKGPNVDAGQQQHAGAPGHTKRPSAEKAAKQKAAAERRVKRAHDPLSKPQPSPVKEGKRRRLRKASELNPSSEGAAITAAVAPPETPAAGPSEIEDLDADDIQAGSVSPGGRQHKRQHRILDADAEGLQQERRASHGKASSSVAAAASNVDAASKSKPSGAKQKHRQAEAPAKEPTAAGQANPELSAAKAAAKTDDTASKPLAGATAHPVKAASRGDSTGAVGSPSVTGNAQAALASSKAGGRLPGSKSSSLPPFALPGSTTTASILSRLPTQAGGLLGSLAGSTPTSTRIAMPSGLGQLSSLRSRVPASDAKESASPTAATPDAEAVAAAAAAEAHLKTVLQQFDTLLHNTLQRTKDSVHRVTQFAVKAAAGKSGKTAAHRLVIMVLDMIETAEMSKRVDLFYLLDSLLQVSSRESKDGNEAKLEACKTFSRVIAAGLHRVATAMAKDSECISKASKVLDLWQRRQILAKSVLKPALQLLTKMKAEHESADAAAAALRTGQLPLLRRPMRLVMPYASLDSDTGLPTFTVSLPLDQWGSLAGFRFTGLNGQVSEFRLKPNWTLPLQEEPEDWDINPATEDLPLDQILANAAAMRREHLEELEEQKEAKAHREASPWGDRLDPHSDYTAAFPASLGSQEEEDMDMEQGASPDEGATGYYETGQDSAFQFELPRAPAHYGASRNSPGVSEDPHRARSYTPWGADAGGSHLWAAGTLGSTWGHMSHTPLQPSRSLYDPFSQTQGHALPHPRLQGLAQDHAFAQAQSQSPEGEPWYRVPYEEPAKPTSVGQAGLHTAGLHTAGQHQLSRSVSEQAMQPQVAVRDSNIDFDVDMGWSDDDAAPPLPAESPPIHDGAPPLPFEEPLPPLPPLPPDEDRPPLPPDEVAAPPLPDAEGAGETRLATAGLFEPSFSSFVLQQPGQTPPPPLPPTGYGSY